MTDTATNRVQADQLRQYLEQVERIKADQSDLAEVLKEKMAEIKGAGYDTKVFNKIISDRAADSAKLSEFEAVLELYKSSLGM